MSWAETNAKTKTLIEQFLLLWWRNRLPQTFDGVRKLLVAIADSYRGEDSMSWPDELEMRRLQLAYDNQHPGQDDPPDDDCDLPRHEPLTAGLVLELAQRLEAAMERTCHCCSICQLVWAARIRERWWSVMNRRVGQ